jgi:hypothetical protein
MRLVNAHSAILSFAAAILILAAGCAPPPVVQVQPEPQQQPPVVRTDRPAPAPAPIANGVVTTAFDPDTVTFSPFDTGRMWTFDHPPTEYLQETYGIAPDAAWYARARLGTLRFGEICSASFVSPRGLILTNHHCARESITAVAREGEELDETGFIATSRQEERRVEDLAVEQLIELFDVTSRIEAAVVGQQTATDRAAARSRAIERLEEELAAARGGEAAGIRAQVVEFYSGGAYSAYIYRRFDDVRIVFAPELAVGFFGGDPDNFTYPRYTLDYAFFRAYDATGQPLDTGDFYFPWSADGSQEGDLTFVIGNPGSTSRLQTVAQLLYRRDVREPAILDLVASRADIYEAFIEAHPEYPEVAELRDTWFSLSNARKAYSGMVAGLRDDYIIARRAAAERALQQAIAADPELAAEYEGVVDRIADNRRQMRQHAADAAALLGMTPGTTTASNVLGRALFAYGFGLTGNPGLREGALGVEEDRPRELEIALLQAKLEEFVHYFGARDPVVRQILRDRSPDVAAVEIYDASELRTHEGTQALIARGNVARSDDPGIQVARALWPRFASYQQAAGGLDAQLGELSAQLGRARFAIHGTDIPPDATFTLRINDGVVAGYPYNGTVAPPYTTFYGMYDRHFSHTGTDLEEYFQLGDRWLPIPAGLDLTTPLNFVTTNDIVGGSSGSPVLNRELQLVGVAFDGNIESLPGDYIYMPEVNRSIIVDSRAILHTLETVYRVQRLVDELNEGVLQP